MNRKGGARTLNTQHDQERAALTPTEKMEIIAILNDLMNGEGDTFPREHAQILFDHVPQVSTLKVKFPYLGHTEKSGRTEGVAAGVGGVAVGGEERQKPDRQSEKMLEFRFGMWEAQRIDRIIYIEHMWSHHAMTGFMAKRARLFLEMDEEEGVVQAAVLVGHKVEAGDTPESTLLSMLQFVVLKHDDGMCRKAAEMVLAYVTGAHRPKPQGGLTVLIAFLVFWQGVASLQSSLFTAEQIAAIPDNLEFIKLGLAFWLLVIRPLNKGYRYSLTSTAMGMAGIRIVVEMIYLFVSGL